MEAQELRIGSWVEFEPADGLGFEIIQVVELPFEKQNNAKPIPLTEDWLLNFGFDKIGEDYFIESVNKYCKKIRVVDFEYRATGEHDKTFLFPYSDDNYYMNGSYARLTYVHQLQNLYFALTGKELEMK